MNKKPTIAFLINQFYNTYNNIIWRNVVEITKKRKDLNLLFFMGKELLTPYRGDIHYNSIYSLINKNVIDCVIIGAPTGTFVENEVFTNFIKKFEPIPVVTFAFQAENYPAVLVNGKKGIIEAIDHLVNVHNVRNIAFIKGPEYSQEAYERFEAYLEGLKKHGIKFDENLVVPGNFAKDRGYNGAKEIILERKLPPEAIICANDEMALGALNFMIEQKIPVPDKIKIIGFDDIVEVKLCYPPISSISQPFKQQMEKVIEIALNLIEGKEVEKVTILDTKFIPRTSCGCFENDEESTKLEFYEKYDVQPLIKMSETLIDKLTENLDFYFENTIKSKDDDFINYCRYALNLLFLENVDTDSFKERVSNFIANKIEFYKNDETISKLGNEILNNFRVIVKDYEKRIAINTIFLERNQRITLELIGQELSTSFNLRKLASNIKRHLDELGIKNFLLCLYEGKVKWDKRIDYKIPENARIILDIRDGKEIKHKNNIIKTENLFPKDFLSGDNTQGAIIPLFFSEDQFGYFILYPLLPDNLIYETIQKYISNSIKGYKLITSEKSIKNKLIETAKKLKEANKQIEKLAILDELTGLYNRRGFMTIATHLIELARRRKRDFLLFYIDMDKLKYINDTFGHKEGDVAIKAVGNILKKTFRQTDILARFGGDEFVVLAVDCSIDELSAVEERLKNNLDSYNETSAKKYTLSFSYGVAPYDRDKFHSIYQLLEEADKNLYKAKHRK